MPGIALVTPATMNVRQDSPLPGRTEVWRYTSRGAD